jgi:methylglyoxal/glyoxal reductase
MSSPKKRVSIDDPSAAAEEEAASKRPKVDVKTTKSSNQQQSSLLNFFKSSSTSSAIQKNNKSNENRQSNEDQDDDNNNGDTKPAAVAASRAGAASAATTVTTNGDNNEDDYKAVVPKKVDTPFNVVWETGLYDYHVIIRKSRGKDIDKDRTKIAAFDLDGTLLQWSSQSPGFWPSQLTHYELWNTNVITKLQDLYDNQNYRLVVFSNQGAVQKAHTGRKATTVKTLLDWIATQIDRPIVAVLSTRSPKKSSQSFHKPTPNMWTQVLAERICSKVELDLSNSFFVGDSADESDSQGGVDRKFSAAVGISFYTPDEFFGPSNQEMRSKAQLCAGGIDIPPPEALTARSALLGGYLDGPILLILCGVQGSGKSTFCEKVLDGARRAASYRACIGKEDEWNVPTDEEVDEQLANDTHKWLVVSQDTINNGKPGKREKVEDEARVALRQGRSVIVDRMHIDVEQRRYFVDLAAQENVPAHIVVLNPPKHVIAERVKNRTSHPGKVQGDQGVRLTMQSLERMVLPKYDEAGETSNIRLISCASTDDAAAQLAFHYGGLSSIEYSHDLFCHDDNRIIEKMRGGQCKYLESIPGISLGTMGMGRRTCTETVDAVLQAGFPGIDTAPTYKNEDKVGESQMLRDYPFSIIAKVPKRAVQPSEVRSELEQTLKNLKKKNVSVLLLHWPSDVIAAGTLKQVWATMEELLNEGKCQALGVCNFNQGALGMLLSVCTIPPVVNQVERHPLLSQLELVDYCARNNICLQAHTPLGGGREELLSHPVVTKIAKEIDRSPAQVVIQWNIQQGMAVVVKCSTLSHGQELFTDGEKPRKKLSPDHMKALDGMNNGTRFVAPPFMYGTGDVYFWGDRMPVKKTTT